MRSPQGDRSVLVVVPVAGAARNRPERDVVSVAGELPARGEELDESVELEPVAVAVAVDGGRAEPGGRVGAEVGEGASPSPRKDEVEDLVTHDDLAAGERLACHARILHGRSGARHDAGHPGVLRPPGRPSRVKRAQYGREGFLTCRSVPECGSGRTRLSLRSAR